MKRPLAKNASSDKSASWGRSERNSMTFNKSFVRISLLMIIFGLAMLLAIIGSALLLVQRTHDSFQTLVDERAIRSSAADLFSLLQDAETGQRGYLLTLNEDFLTPYNEAVGEIRTAEAKLSGLIAGDQSYQGDMQPLYELIDSKLQEMASTVRLAKSGDTQEAIRVVQQGFGQKVMDGIRTRMQNIIDISDTHIQANIAKQLRGSITLKWIVLGAGVAIVIVLGGAIFVIMRHIQSINATRREVLRLNEDLEQRVVERTDDLVKANQEIQRYAYIVTHDLRAPLVNIMGFTSELEMSLKQLQAYVLADGEPLSEQEITDARNAAREDVPEALAFIRSSTSKMDGLISAILKISRDGRRQLKPERFNLKEILDNSAASLHHIADSADGSIEVQSPPMFVVSDRLSLEQIFTNLIDNALKYRNKNRPPQVVIKASLKGKMLEAEVIDNGRGIGADDMERVFELFRRAGPQDQTGEGIGLAHVRSLARNLGGDISVRSEPGVGSTFTLRIPADLTQVLRSV
jgi:signal transduction histidine kinase